MQDLKTKKKAAAQKLLLIIHIMAIKPETINANVT